MELQDYEYIRNLTLLFFLERLLDKGESRSLHDLSCQFGTKGFTKEMRQIAGGSKAGLKKFLAGYPSLFSIQNDYVSIAEIIRHSKEEDSSSPGKNGSRDYFHEAMLYFKDKLKQYGEDIEVPIKSLLGHRSQAPPEVRHVSGQHVKEFRDFLLRFEDEFVVGEETIYLKEYDGNITRMYTDDQPVSRSSQPSSLDPSQTVPPPALPVPAVGLSGSEQQVQSKQIIDFLKSTILSSNFESKPSVETLFTMLEGHFSSNSSNSSSSGLKLPLRTSQDLKTFLKIYPHIFCVQGGLVSLVAATATPGASPSRRISRDTMSHDSKASLKDRIGFLVQRAVQDNSSSQRGVSSSGRTSTTTTATPSMTSSNSAVAPAASSNNEAVTKIISSVDESVTVVQGLMSAHKVVALSVKGVNLGSEGSIISSIQIGTLDGLSYVFDVLACPNLIEKGKLKIRFFSRRIAIHAYGITAKISFSVSCRGYKVFRFLNFFSRNS